MLQSGSDFDSKIYRILHVTGGMNSGGAETMLMNLYRKVNRNKVQFDFISYTDSKCHYDDEINLLGGRIFYVHPPEGTNPFKFIVELYKVIKKNGPYQAIHTHTLFNSGLALLTAHLAGIKIRICHAHTSNYFVNTLVKRIYYSFMRCLINIYANRHIACSNVAGEFLFGKSSIKKYSILLNAIDLNPYIQVNMDRVKELAEELEISKNTLVLGHVGNFGEHKNHKFLIKLAEYIKAQGIDFKLILIGQGYLKSKIENIVKEKKLDESIIFLGLQIEIPVYMKLFDVFVFPSLFEGLGIVLIEAQAAGTPCVVSSMVPSDCDMGLGLIKWLNLDDSLGAWSQAVIDSKKLTRLLPETTTKAILARGYNLDVTTKDLLCVYGLKELCC